MPRRWWAAADVCVWTTLLLILYVTNAQHTSSVTCLSTCLVCYVIHRHHRLSDGLLHKGTMSTNPVFKKGAKVQRSYVPLCGHTISMLVTSARTVTIIDKITLGLFCDDANKTNTSVELNCPDMGKCSGYQSPGIKISISSKWT